MLINFCFAKSYNFGDAVNYRFYSLLCDNKIRKLQIGSTETHYLGTGSILKLCNDKSIIVGTGFISEDDDLGKGYWCGGLNKVYKKPKKIISVRGPKTREKLIKMGIKCPNNYGDPLILFPLIYDKFTSNNNKIGIIPHYIDQNTKNVNVLINNLKNMGNQIIVINILVGNKFENLIDNINKCDTIISSSLHGVILGIVYGKKTIFTEFSNNVIGNKFKFYDFFESLDIKYDIPKFDDLEILEKYIVFDKKKLLNIGLNMIKLFKFIGSERKNFLLKKWNKIINCHH